METVDNLTLYTWLVLALLAVGLGGFVGGRIGNHLFRRSLTHRLIELESAIDTLAERFARSQKIQAGVERQRRGRVEDEILALAEQQTPAAQITTPKNYLDWYRSKMVENPKG